MTVRKPVSTLENLWNDAQRVSQEDMQVEQAHDDQQLSGVVNNHFGSGVLLASPAVNIIWDSANLDATQAALLAAGNFDGTGLAPQAQPTDNILGNQLAVNLSNSIYVMGRFAVKVVIIGLDFNGVIQSDRFYFYANETQVTRKHYTKVLTIFTNDFNGNNICSRAFGGRLLIQETSSLQLSTDPLMIEQDIEPDLFWRDFKLATLALSLEETIQAGIGSEYSVDGLNINTDGLDPQVLNQNDVTSQVGQKFIAYTNNIQKITLLLGIAGTGAGPDNEFDWSGDLVISVYALQSSVSCPSAIVPDLAIDFDPAATPLVQISYTQPTLQAAGWVLDNIPQPIDFVFSNSIIGQTSSSRIVPGSYYAITVRRSGDTSVGSFLIGCGQHSTENSLLTLFNGSWIDNPSIDLWFQVWTDACKVADGNAYDGGVGVSYLKTVIDPVTGATIDFCADAFPLATTGEGLLNTAIIQATFNGSDPAQDERTGNTINERQQFVPSFSFVDPTALQNLKLVGEPLIVGAVKDTNPKGNVIFSHSHSRPGLVKGDQYIIVNPSTDLLANNLLGSTLVPNVLTSPSYMIVKSTLCVDSFGDINGDGSINQLDVNIAATLVGENINHNSTQNKINAGQFTTLELLRADVDGDGYVSVNDLNLLSAYVGKSINSFPAGTSFTHLALTVQQLVGRSDGYFDCGNGNIRLDGYLGEDVISSSSLDPAQQLQDGYIVDVNIEITDPSFTTVPFVAINYQILPQPFWQPYLLQSDSTVKTVPCTFSSTVSNVINDCSSGTLVSSCSDQNANTVSTNPGRNDFYIPNNLMIGNGQILNTDNSFYKVDFEIGSITLQLPQVPLVESAINIFTSFCAEASPGTGLTVSGFPALRYSDCSAVQPDDLQDGRLRFDVALQAFSPNLDGYSEVDGYVLPVTQIGISMSQTTGILKLNMTDLYQDPVYLTLVTKIQITVFLKRGGFNNVPLVVSSNQIVGLIAS